MLTLLDAETLSHRAMTKVLRIKGKIWAIPKGAECEFAESLYPGFTFDSALPQDWVDECYERGQDVRPHIVWAYPKGSIYGYPLPITEEGVHMLGRLAMSVGR